MNRPPCPKCESILVFKHGSYTEVNGDVVQRWFCQTCRKGFNPIIQETPAPTSETSVAHPMRGY
jgi:transposase-like protein